MSRILSYGSQQRIILALKQRNGLSTPRLELALPMTTAKRQQMRPYLSSEISLLMPSILYERLSETKWDLNKTR